MLAVQLELLLECLEWTGDLEHRAPSAGTARIGALVLEAGLGPLRQVLEQVERGLVVNVEPNRDNIVRFWFCLSWVETNGTHQPDSMGWP